VRSRLFLAWVLAALAASASALPQKPPRLDRKVAKAAADLAEDWWKARPATRFEDWDPAVRKELEERARALGPIADGTRAELVEILWKPARKNAPRLVSKDGKLSFETPYGEAWAWVASAGKQAPLLVGLHGGGEDAGSADEARGNWTRKGCVGLYPQGIRLVHDTWNTVHGERFVLTLIEQAKLHMDVDPDRVVVCGFSMGGSGSWFFAGRHADLFCGAAPFSGVIMAAPKSQLESKEEVRALQHGLLPNVRNLAMAYTIGLADRNCMPGTYLYAADRLAELAEADPGGYAKIRFRTIPGLGHQFPPGEPEGALATLLAERRETFPEVVVWEYVSDPAPEHVPGEPLARLAKPCFYWLGCRAPQDQQRIRAVRKGNEIDLVMRGTLAGVQGLTIYLNEAMIDPAQEVVVRNEGQEVYRGTPVPDAWTVLESLDARVDRAMTFDRRIEL